MRELVDIICEFVRERDWEQFHQPKSLAISAGVEMGELLELFQWLTDEEVEQALTEDHYREKLSHEIADIMIYLLRLADVASIDASSAIMSKMDVNRQKYPATDVEGRRPKDPR
ncbi:MAG: nucleotide pyrophosphohydrolase [Candidatus Thorarchaeota archaeon]|nr:nucleotide pyrophosphohydrolase [Candidatus Thorarchaeota archaeon]